MGLAAAKEIARRGHTVVATMRKPPDFAALREFEGTFDVEAWTSTTRAASTPHRVRWSHGAVASTC
jgi:hypothetical protein